MSLSINTSITLHDPIFSNELKLINLRQAGAFLPFCKEVRIISKEENRLIYKEMDKIPYSYKSVLRLLAVATLIIPLIACVCSMLFLYQNRNILMSADDPILVKNENYKNRIKQLNKKISALQDNEDRIKNVQIFNLQLELEHAKTVNKIFIQTNNLKEENKYRKASLIISSWDARNKKLLNEQKLRNLETANGSLKGLPPIRES